MQVSVMFICFALMGKRGFSTESEGDTQLCEHAALIRNQVIAALPVW